MCAADTALLTRMLMSSDAAHIAANRAGNYRYANLHQTKAMSKKQPNTKLSVGYTTAKAEFLAKPDPFTVRENLRDKYNKALDKALKLQAELSKLSETLDQDCADYVARYDKLQKAAQNRADRWDCLSIELYPDNKAKKQNNGSTQTH